MKELAAILVFLTLLGNTLAIIGVYLAKPKKRILLFPQDNFTAKPTPKIPLSIYKKISREFQPYSPLR